MSASGGTDGLQHYLAGDADHEQRWGPNNEGRRRGVRAKLTGQLGSKLDVRVCAGYDQTGLELPQNDDTREYPTGGEYGSEVNFPVSSDERNNPNFTGSLDRDA